MSICDIKKADIHFQVYPSLPHVPQPRVLVVESKRHSNLVFSAEGRPEPGYCLFQYTLAGRGYFEAGGQRWELHPGMGFLCDIQDPAYRYGMSPDATEPWQTVYLEMLGDSTRMMVHDMIHRFGYIYELDPAAYPISLYKRWFKHAFDGVVSMADGVGIVTDLLKSLMDSVRLSKENEGSSRLVQKALRLLSSRGSEKWNASLLAQELCVSREHLGRLFSSHLGRSPYAYIRDYRIQRACIGLRHTSDSIKQIAYRNGFNSAEAFSKTFHQRMGTTPQRYRAGG